MFSFVNKITPSVDFVCFRLPPQNAPRNMWCTRDKRDASYWSDTENCTTSYNKSFLFHTGDFSTISRMIWGFIACNDFTDRMISRKFLGDKSPVWISNKNFRLNQNISLPYMTEHIRMSYVFARLNITSIMNYISAMIPSTHHAPAWPSSPRLTSITPHTNGIPNAITMSFQSHLPRSNFRLNTTRLQALTAAHMTTIHCENMNWLKKNPTMEQRPSGGLATLDR